MESDEDRGPEPRWDARWATRGSKPQEPAAFVVEAARYLPGTGRALDVAGGAGRHAAWLAARGLEVTLVDVSTVALEHAARLARSRRVNLSLVQRNLEVDGLPSGTWDVILIHHFLDRALLGEVPDALEPEGVLVFCQPTRRNLERHERPGPEYLLKEGELADLVAGLPLDPVVLEESWGIEGRHEARLVARLADQRRAM